MISHDLLDRLRALNEAARELKRNGLSTPEREKREARMEKLRASLPTALLSQHDRIVREGNESVAAIADTGCGRCHLQLPVALLAELNQPGHIAVCPHCGVFVFNASVGAGRPTP